VSPTTPLSHSHQHLGLHTWETRIILPSVMLYIKFRGISVQFVDRAQSKNVLLLHSIFHF
jgi:hypothetical protein